MNGPAPLAPIQRWFFAAYTGALHHYNHTVLLAAKQRLDAGRLAKVFRQLIAHHDLLRAAYRFEHGEVVQEIIPTVDFQVTEMNLVTPAQPFASMTEYGRQSQALFDLATPPLMKVILFRLPDTDHVLITMHHLLVDGVSWRILFDDLATGYQQALADKPVTLPPKTHAYSAWTASLEREAAAQNPESERDYWQSIESECVTPLPLDNAAGSRRYRDSQVLTARLPYDLTESLLKQANQPYNTRINDLLLTILAQALGHWTGNRQHGIALESHGRDQTSLDVSRTLGWFTAIFPVILKLNAADDTGAHVRQVKESLRRIPGNGVGYGVLRHLGASGAATGAQPTPPILFNYLGQFDRDIPGYWFTLAAESVSENIDPMAELSHELLFSSIVIDGRLAIRITFSPERIRPAAIQQLLDLYQKAAEALVAHCLQQEGTELTPSDLSYKAIDTHELDEILDDIEL